MARRTRKKAAPAGRVLATGISATAMFGIVAVFASQPPPAWELTTTGDASAGTNTESGSPASVAPTTGVLPTTMRATTIVTRIERRVIAVPDDGAAGSGAGGTAKGTAPAPAPTGQPPQSPTQPAPTSPTPPPPTMAPTPTPPPTAPPTTAAPVPKCKASKC